MKHTRIIVTHYGGPDALQAIQEECPEPKVGEVRVRVLAGMARSEFNHPGDFRYVQTA